MAEAGPLQHVADGIADTLNEGRETDGTKADGTETDKAEADGDATNGTETARQPTDSLPAKQQETTAGSPGAAVYRPNTKGERLHSLSLFSCPANSPKPAEPLPDIEA